MGLTPMMKQYFEVKDRYKDCILFFRLGDFYEMFFEDAKTASKELELVLTGRDCGLEEKAPMCGIPYHASNGYIGKLISKGYKVAICEQVEDVSKAKGIVKRDVVKVITPGTYSDSSFLSEDMNNYIMSIFLDYKNNGMSISTTDISTGDFYTTSFELNEALVLDEVSKFNPKEILISSNCENKFLESLSKASNALFNVLYMDFSENLNFKIKEQFADENIEDFNDLEKISIYGLVSYLLNTQKTNLTNINKINKYNIVDYMTIDSNSRRNLELTENLWEKTKMGSLLWVLDNTKTSMGSREIRRWVEQPLINKSLIENRLGGVEELYNSISLNEDIRSLLHDIYDIERIVGKVSSKNVNAKDLLSLKISLNKIPSIKEILKGCESTLLNKYFNDIDELQDVKELLQIAIHEEPSLSIKEGNIIKDGYNETIDELRTAKLHGKEWIASLENREREFTGIKSLKVGFNKVFGYYIEISRANYDLIPEGRYIRKQTLANAERYITDELKQMEDKILGAEEKLFALEYELFTKIRDEVEKTISRMQKTAKIIAEIDCISSLAIVALENNYVKPLIDEDGEISIKDGRHPVVEKVISRGEFVANDTLLNKSSNQLLIITGPNMAGKSTFMRQVALITLMSQIGSFVPASYAKIGICDKIFTRIGASDDLAGGKSTFMVEMWEVSNILKNATKNSLVILDEVGRGTSTYDGLSIAWSVIEYICKNNNLKFKTLFATHYHELTSLENEIEGIKNYSVSVKEIDNTIVFLRKIVEGGADQSYGIEVAKLAGLPEKVIARAKEILSSLEEDKQSSSKTLKETSSSPYIIKEQEEIIYNNTCDACEYKVKSEETIEKKETQEVAISKEETIENIQLDFNLLAKEGLINDLKNLNILEMTPMDAMNKLYSLIKDAKSIN